MSNLASNCDDSFYQPPFSNLLQAADPSSRFWNYAGDHGLKQLPETSHDALTNLTVPSNPSNYPYAQPSVYPSYDPVHSSNSIPSTSRDPHVLATPSRGGNNTTTFGRDSHFPNDALSELYRIIKVSSFVLNHQLEPVLSSEEGRTLVKAILYVPDCPNAAWEDSDRSVFTLFIDCKAYMCLICGRQKTSLERVIGCVRSHLGHRPFICPGAVVGCASCKRRKSPARFFASSLVDDHVKGQTNKYKCPDSECDAMIRRGGMQRHWNSMHKGRPFPIEIFPEYGKRKKPTSLSVSS